MSVLLQNTEKPDGYSVNMGVSQAVDVAKLDVCFGGFTPMALSDGTATRKQVLEAEERVRAHRESCERAAAVEAARASEVREWVDADGTAWSYVVLDDVEVRVEACRPAVPDIVIPHSFDGKPTVAIAADACAFHTDITSVVCPDGIVAMGPCAFRGCTALRSIVFPSDLADYESDWIRGCRNVEYIRLPGMVPKLEPSVFDNPNLRHLVIGAGTADIAPGMFAKSALSSIEVDAGNPFLMTDGMALYSRDGMVLVALVVPVEDYAIRDGCRKVAKKGFSTFSCVRRIEVPVGLEVLGEFAFSRTAITEFAAPSSLRVICEKAFFNCVSLREVRLNEGLASIGDNAFSGTALGELRLPASIRELGSPLAALTELVYAGPDATFSIAEGSRYLELDGDGGLYGKGEDGARLIRMMDPHAQRYDVRPGTTEVSAGAFAGHAHIAEVVFPEGLQAVRDGAFKACHSLKKADLPESVELVGDEAFLDTSLASLHIPAGLRHIGKNAYVTHGSHHGTSEPSLHDVAVAQGNERFYMEPGLLLERKEGGRARVLLCTGNVEVVKIPKEVDEIAPYALNDVSGVRELHLSDRIGIVGIRGLAIDGLAELIHVDLESPIAGHDFFDLRFPDTDRGAQQMMLALSVPSRVDVAVLFEHYDNSIVNGSSFDPENKRGLGLYDQGMRILERMLDPVFLTPVNRSMCERFLRSSIIPFSVEIAKHDNRRAIDSLLDLGYLNEDNLFTVIDGIGAVQDASMTGYLLEVKRVRFGQDAFDFEL